MGMSDSTDSRVDIEILAEEYLERRRKGEAVSVDDYANDHPDLADEIREVFPAFEAMQSLASDWKRTVADNQKVGPELPFQLGDFVLEREIGRGGMGIVYEAQNTNLQRQVAVKLLKSSSLHNEKDIARFHREARAAAALHHTNIVPVFGFGEAEGFHYLAMQLIGGTGLDAYIDELRSQQDQESASSPAQSQQVTGAAEVHPTKIKGSPGTAATQKSPNEGQRCVSGAAKSGHDNPDSEYGSPTFWRQVALIGVQAANALHHAHTHGTVHRDIKPGNLLLDDEGVVWVADFGLARQNADGNLTQSGVLSGTLRYLAPEHFHGQCDERTDQHGLGLSLYELVTLQSATGNGSSHAEVMRRITEAKTTPPRQINPEIPRDLETIILKAISPEATKRFVSCQMLAEDLQRFADGRPIQSRPTTRIERLWRWANRNPALAVSTALSATLLMMVAAVAVLGYQAERQQRQRAESTSEYALQALDTVFDRYGRSQRSSEFVGDGAPTAVLTKDAATMLEELLPIFDALAAMDDQSSGVQLRAVTARRRVGRIQQQLGNFDEAINAYHQTIGSYHQLPDIDANNRGMLIAGLLNDIGTCQLMLGQNDVAHASHSSALQQLLELPETSASELKYQLARTHYLLTRKLKPGQSPTTIDSFRLESLNSNRRPPPRPGKLPFPGDRRRQSRGGPGGPPRSSFTPPGRPPGQRSIADMRNLEAAIALLESLEAESGNQPRVQHLLAICLKAIASGPFFPKQPDEKAAEERALAILSELAEEHPNVPEYLQSLAETLAGLDTMPDGAISSEDLAAAERRLRKALAVGTDLVSQHPYVPEYTLTLIHTNNKLAHILERKSEASRSHRNELKIEAITAYQSAANLQAGLVKRFPDAASYQDWLKQFQRSIISLELDLAESGNR